MLTISSLFLYLLVGAIVGVIGALLGIGGGILTVPALLVLFSFFDFPQAYIMHVAIGTSLASMVINTFSSTYFHNRKKDVVWKVIGRILLGIVIGCFVGVFISRELSSNTLQIIFGIFAILLGLFFIKPLKETKAATKIPGFFAFTLIGIGIASLANLLGLGGGFFMLPILFYFHFKGPKAIGTSAAVSFFITLGGAIGCLISVKEPIPVPGCYGYVYIPAFLAISLSSLITSYFGVKLAHSLPINLIRKIFAATVIGVGILMIFK